VLGCSTPPCVSAAHGSNEVSRRRLHTPSSTVRPAVTAGATCACVAGRWCLGRRWLATPSRCAACVCTTTAGCLAAGSNKSSSSSSSSRRARQSTWSSRFSCWAGLMAVASLMAPPGTLPAALQSSQQRCGTWQQTLVGLLVWRSGGLGMGLGDNRAGQCVVLCTEQDLYQRVCGAAADWRRLAAERTQQQGVCACVRTCEHRAPVITGAHHAHPSTGDPVTSRAGCLARRVTNTPLAAQHRVTPKRALRHGPPASAEASRWSLKAPAGSSRCKSSTERA
jgi:hypothetical protein